MAIKSQKSATIATSKNSPSKDAKKKAKSLAKKNLEKVEEEIKAKESAPAERELKYIYPADIKSQSEKKDFRRKMRAAKSSFDKSIARLRRKDTPEAKAELKEIRANYDKFLQKNYPMGAKINEAQKN